MADLLISNDLTSELAHSNFTLMQEHFVFVQGVESSSVQLASYTSDLIILYFYPKDNTPGCTLESQDFSTKYQNFENNNIMLIGISRDSVISHKKFIAKLCLPFPLISDQNEQLCEAFGVIKMKNMYGKQVRGIERSTFIINKKGEIVKEWRKVKVEGHIEEVMAYLGI